MKVEDVIPMLFKVCMLLFVAH